MMVGSCSSTCSSSSRKRLNSSRGTDYGKYIAEDVMMNIFVRLPIKAILKIRSVSRFWRSIICNPDFSTMWIKFNGFAECILFYNLERPFKKSDTIVSLNPNPNRYCSYGGFLLNCLRPKLYLLASRDGLILCLTKPNMAFYVCNPLTNELDELVLPTSPVTCSYEFVTGFVKKTTDSLLSRNYMVVLIYKCRYSAFSFVINVFLPSLGTWKTYVVSCPERVTMSHALSSHVVSRNGVLYWMEGKGRILITVNLKNIDEPPSPSCKLINLPMEEIVKPSEANQYLGESEGFIFYSQCYNGELSVWLLEDNDLNIEGASNWRLTHRVITKEMQLCSSKYRIAINLAFMAILKRRNIDFKPLAFNPVDRNILILAYSSVARDKKIIFTYNMKTKTMIQLTSDDTSTREVKSFVLVPSLAR